MDEDLRELERAAQRGEPEARARLLAAWRRAGRLDDERLSFAASLGDPAARALLGEAAPDEAADVPAWLESAREWPWALEVTLLAAVVGARAALGAFEREHPEDRGPRRCVEAAEAFVACPCAEHAEKAHTAGEWQARAHLERARRGVEGRPRLALVAERAAFTAAQAVGLHPVPDRARMLAVISFENALGVADGQVGEACRAALSRWLLGA